MSLSLRLSLGDTTLPVLTLDSLRYPESFCVAIIHIRSWMLWPHDFANRVYAEIRPLASYALENANLDANSSTSELFAFGAASSYPMEHDSSGIREPLSRGLAAGLVLKEAATLSGTGQQFRLEDLDAWCAGTSAFGESVWTDEVWASYCCVTPLWAAYAAARELEDDNKFPCHTNTLHMFLARAEQFRLQAERIVPVDRPLPILAPDEAVIFVPSSRPQ